MDIITIILAFGGGVLGAYVGAVPAFIMTGVFALVGAGAGALGIDAGFLTGTMAFGIFLSPAVAFGGGVAAAAFAGRKGKLASGADVSTPLHSLGDPMVLVVGGVFGIIGMLLQQLISFLPPIIATDAPGFGVVVIGIICRLVFGKTGLTGKYDGQGPRHYTSVGGAMGANIVMGAGLGLVIGGIAYLNEGNAAVLGNLAVLVFGFSAITLTFAIAGQPTPATHHITLPAALGAVALMGKMGAPGAIVGGILFGVLGALLGDFFGNTVNSYCDSHIDPPACTICLLTIASSVINNI